MNLLLNAIAGRIAAQSIRKISGGLVSALVAATLVPQAAIGEESRGVLLIESDFVYEGAFRIPEGGTKPSTFAYGAFAVTYNPVNDSLFLVGHDHTQWIAEISIPPLKSDVSVDELNESTFVQPFTDPLEGRRRDVNPNDPNDQKIGGHLVYDNELYISVYSYYDANGTQSASHFSRPLELSASGQLTGPARVGKTYPGWVSGYMTPIPATWQSALGGPALTGNFGLAIASLQSWGPSVSVFDPKATKTQSPAPATLLVGYPDGQSILNGGYQNTSQFWNGSSRGTGVIFPEGSRSVLFFGSHGTGDVCYGTGAECGDPTKSEKGVHAYPYKYQVWAYDAADLAKVRNGKMLPRAVYPYAIWNPTVPHERDDEHLTGGAAYDAAGNRIFFVQRYANHPYSVIHVFSIDSPPRPEPPPAFGK